MSNISDRIKYYRKKRGMTQMSVSTAMGIRVDNYAKYESGARIPRDDRLINLAKIFGISFDALKEGIEREFADLLKAHALGAITGEAGSFSAFFNDMELSSEAYSVVASLFSRGVHSFTIENRELFEKYMSNPSMADLIALYDMYKEQSDFPVQVSDPIKMHFVLAPLEPAMALKWAFCVAFHRYLEDNDPTFIMDEAKQHAGSFLEHFDELQYFAIKLFVPYLSFIIDAVELCMNTTMDDFDIAFLFNALTPPDEGDNEECFND